MTLLLPGTTKPGSITPYTLAPTEQLPIPFLCDTASEGVTALALLAWPLLLGSYAGARHTEAPPPLRLSLRPTPPLRLKGCAQVKASLCCPDRQSGNAWCFRASLL